MMRSLKGILFILLLLTACQKEISEKQSEYFIKFYGNYLDNEGNDVQSTNDGGYVFTGAVQRDGSGKDIVLIKVDRFGNQVSWSPQYFGGDGDDEGYSIRVLPDGGYIIAGYVTNTADNKNKDAVLIRTNSVGELLWQQEFGGAWDDEAKSVINKPGGGYIFAGYKGTQDGQKRIYLVNVDDQGNEVSVTTRPLDGEELSSIIELSDGNFLVAGTREISTGAVPESDILILVLNEVGNDLDNYSFGQAGVNEVVSGAFPASDGGFYLIGTSSALQGSKKDIMIKKLDVRKTIWEKTVSGDGLLDGKAICETMDGSLVLIANKNSNDVRDINLYFLNSRGGVISSKEFGASGEQTAEALTYLNGQIVILGKNALSAGSNGMITLIKTDQEGNIWK